MMILKALLKSEQGIVLAISLLVLTMLIAGGMGAIFSTQMDLNSSGNFRTGRQAFYVAEAGLHQAWQELDRGGGANEFEVVFSRPGVTDLLGRVNFAGGNYVVTAEGLPGPHPRRIKVTSSGCFPAGDPCPTGHSKVVIESQFRREPLFPCVLCGKEGVSLSGGAITDSYDSRVGPYSVATAGSQGDVESNGDISLSGNTTLVKGNAAASGNVSASAGATVAGTTASNAPPLGFPRVIACGPPFSPGAGISGGSYNPSSGQLRGAGSDAIIIANGAYCLSSVELADNSTLTITGPVTLNLTAASSFTGGGIINQSANVENLQIVSSFSSSGFGITVSSGSLVYSTIYAPDARVEVTGQGDFYGAIVGRTVVNNGGARFHYDRKLREGEDGGVKMVLWKESL